MLRQTVVSNLTQDQFSSTILTDSAKTYLIKISRSNKYSIIVNRKASILVHILFILLSVHPHILLSGSWFVLERWITDSPFQHASQPAQSDLDVARGLNAKHILEKHWDTWITEEDWVWISERGINTVRIPVSCLTLFHAPTFNFIDWVLSSLWSWSLCSSRYGFPSVSGGVCRCLVQDSPSNRNSSSLWYRRPTRWDFCF